MGAREMDINKIYPPLKDKQKETGKKIEPGPLLSPDPDVLEIQKLYKYNYVFSVKNHEPKRGVSNFVVMVTPEEMAKVAKSVISKRTGYDEKASKKDGKKTSSMRVLSSNEESSEEAILGDDREDEGGESSILALGIDVMELDDRVIALRNRLANAEIDIEDLQDRMNAVESRLNTLESNQTKICSRIIELQQRFDPYWDDPVI